MGKAELNMYNVAVVGATGLVGRKMVRVLEERNFPVGRLKLLATKNSVGKIIQFRSEAVPVKELKPDSFKRTEIALFSAGSEVSKHYAPIAVKSGVLVIDNSSAFRMDKNVPLVVPEVNPDQVMMNSGIISNPNCSTIQMVVVLKPLHLKWKILRVVVSTYQSVTGAGKFAVDQLESELANKKVSNRKLPHEIAYNLIPQIDVFNVDGYSREEYKMINETKKIMNDDAIKVTATCVRVPVLGGHSESVNIEFEKDFKIEEVSEILNHSPGVCVQDDIKQNIYPMPVWSHEKDLVFVGRIRRDETIKNGLNLWIVSDNLRKGAATNAVQIAEEWIKQRTKLKL